MRYFPIDPATIYPWVAVLSMLGMAIACVYTISATRRLLQGDSLDADAANKSRGDIMPTFGPKTAALVFNLFNDLPHIIMELSQAPLDGDKRKSVGAALFELASLAGHAALANNPKAAQQLALSGSDTLPFPVLAGPPPPPPPPPDFAKIASDAAAAAVQAAMAKYGQTAAAGTTPFASSAKESAPEIAAHHPLNPVVG